MKSLFEDTKEDQAKIVAITKHNQETKKKRHEIYINFRTAEDVLDFATILGIDIDDSVRVVDYPVVNLLGETQGVLIQRKEQKKSNRNESWRKLWLEMPEFDQEDNPAFKQITVRFNGNTEQLLKEFAEKISQNITVKTKSIWHPKLERTDNYKLRWIIPEGVEEKMPKNPLYIVSKGRYDTMITARSLERMRVPYYIVVEEQEYEQYCDAVDSKYGTPIILDMKFKEQYNLCDDLGLTKSTGPGPARNFAWEHSKSLGAKAHWVMDDNIVDFYRLHKNLRVRVESGVMFRACEDFIDRFDNIPVSGLQYRFFIAPNSKYPPYALNTRIYSCNLIQNECPLWYADPDYPPYVWRGRYNEDTDLSLRVLGSHKFDIEPMCTLQFNAFLQGKAATQTVKGGNTAEFYHAEDQDNAILHGTSNKSDMQFRLHPEVSRNVWKYGRWHHEVSYHKFKNNKLIKKKGLAFTNEPNNYGLEYIDDYSDQP